MIDLDGATEVGPDVCQYCEHPVTRQFCRVFGDENDVAHRCVECDSYRRLGRGSAAGKSVPVPDPDLVNGRNGGESTALTNNGRRDRGQTTVGWLVFTIVVLSLSLVPLLMVVVA